MLMGSRTISVAILGIRSVGSTKNLNFLEGGFYIFVSAAVYSRVLTDRSTNGRIFSLSTEKDVLILNTQAQRFDWFDL